MIYVKDSLNPESTPYDVLDEKDTEVGPDTPVREIQKRFKKLRRQYYSMEDYDRLDGLNEARALLSSTHERLRIDFFYYRLPDTPKKGIDR